MVLGLGLGVGLALTSVAHAGRAVVSVTNVGAGIDQQAAWRTAMRGRRAYIQCADAAARRARREIRGEVTADLTIDAAGRVTEVRVGREAPDTPAEMRECIVGALRGLAFPAPGQVSRATVQVEAVGTSGPAKTRRAR